MQKKSNLWLIVVIIIVLLALLWPVLRRSKTSVEIAPPGEEATTTSESSTTSEGASLSPSTVAPSVDQTTLTVPGAVSSLDSTRASAMLSLKVFFGNQKRDPKAWQCSTVYPVMRTVANTSAVARAALTELLRGPRAADSAANFFTSLNPGVAIKQLTIANGVARIDFDRPLVAAPGAACLKDGVRAQITETLKQFATVQSVAISVNGILF